MAVINKSGRVQIPDRRLGGCEQEVGPEPGLPGVDCAAHRWKRLRTYHSRICVHQEQDGLGHWRGTGLLHPDRSVCDPCHGHRGMDCRKAILPGLFLPLSHAHAHLRCHPRILCVVRWQF